MRPGERVLLQVNNDLPAVLAWYGMLKAGLVPVATLVQHRTHELTAVARACAPAAANSPAIFAGAPAIPAW